MVDYQIISKRSSKFPENLLETHTEIPSKLFVKGRLLKRDRKAVAIVGSRTATKYGLDNAYKFAYELAKNKITIISGMARGIDTASHKGALDAGGRTIAILGSGIDVIYPRENADLFAGIIKNGAVISEFALGTPPFRHNFLQRNRLVSGISLAVLIIEGRRRSGTLSIANRAADQGKEVFAIPGPVNSPLSALPHYLIDSGARIATKPQDLLDLL